MKRYVLQYQGTGTPPGKDLNHIRGMAGLKVVDESALATYLVEATNAAAGQLKELTSWVVYPETYIPAPDARKKIRQPS